MAQSILVSPFLLAILISKPPRRVGPSAPPDLIQKIPRSQSDPFLKIPQNQKKTFLKFRIQKNDIV